MLLRLPNQMDIKIFKEFARKHYKIGASIDSNLHPIIQLECVMMNLEQLIKDNGRPLLSTLKDILKDFFKGAK